MPKIQFIFNPMYDYLMSLVQLVNQSCMDEDIAETGVVINQQLTEWTRSMEKKLPRSILSEAKFFFLKGVMPGLVALDVVRRENTKTLAELITSINAMTPRRFLLGMLENVLSDPDPETGKAYTEETMPTSLEEIQEKISGRFAEDDQNPECQETLDLFLDACMNPLDTQERLVRLLLKYESPYREMGADFESISLETHQSFSKKWGETPECFLEDVLSLKKDFFESDQTLYLAPSYFLDICYITFIYSGEFGVYDSFIVYGTGVEQRNWFKARKTRRKLLFKILSEENRFEILRLLARHDYYLMELANELGLTSATTSHHISMLIQLDIVEIQREGNKTIYRLKKDLLKNLFAEALQEILLQDNLQ